VASIPLVGQRIAEEWLKVVASRPEDLAAQSIPYLRAALGWLIAQAGGLGVLLLHLLLTVVLSAALYARGDAVGAWVLAFARRLAGPEGERAALLSAQAVRAVALGIVVTAVVQSVIGGIGLAVTGVPYAGLLAAVMLLLGVAQVGPWPVMLSATAWLYWNGDVLWGTVLLVWSIFTTSFDNIVRPILIRRGADLPLSLIFAGVLGGLLAFGVIGLFIGPVILAVTYTLMQTWVEEAGAGESGGPGQ
jgi:predicted PurR-regulated permease PerM